MKWRPLLLLGLCAWFWLIVAYPAYLLDPEHGLLHSGVAVVLCAVPTALTLLWCDIVLKGSAESQLAAVFGGTGLRMLVAVGIAAVLYKNVEEFALGRFWMWIIVFYLVTLAIEMFLVARRHAAMDQASSKTNTPA